MSAGRKIKMRVLPKISDEQHAEIVAKMDARNTRTRGKGGVKFAGHAEGKRDGWHELIEALIKTGKIDEDDWETANSSEHVKDFDCPGCGSSSGFAYRSTGSRTGAHVISCGHRCKPGDVVQILGLEVDEVWETLKPDISEVDASAFETDSSDGSDGYTEQDTEVSVSFRRLSEMTPRPTKWLAIGYLPQAAVAALVGEEGIGKSLWWVWVAAHITTGRANETIGYAGGTPRDIAVVATEDGAGELLERLKLAGADLARVHVLAEDEATAAGMMGDDAAVEALVGTYLDSLRADGISPALVTVDAWLDTVPGVLSVAKPQDARRALSPWKKLAARREVCVLLVGHTNRLDSGSVRDKYGATIVLRQVVRQTIYAARSPLGSLMIGPDKSNHAAQGNAGDYSVIVEQIRPAAGDDPGTTARLKFEGISAAPISEHVSTWHADSRKEKSRERLSGDMQKILSHVERADEPVTAATAAIALGMKKDIVSRYLRRLCDDHDAIERAGRGKYQRNGH